MAAMRHSAGMRNAVAHGRPCGWTPRSGADFAEFGLGDAGFLLKVNPETTPTQARLHTMPRRPNTKKGARQP